MSEIKIGLIKDWAHTGPGGRNREALGLLRIGEGRVLSHAHCNSIVAPALSFVG